MTRSAFDGLTDLPYMSSWTSDRLLQPLNLPFPDYDLISIGASSNWKTKEILVLRKTHEKDDCANHTQGFGNPFRHYISQLAHILNSNTDAECAS